MDRVPFYSIVDESVKAAKSRVSVSSSKFVNAVLRKITSKINLQEFINKAIIDNHPDLNKRISLIYSFPLWLVRYWSGNHNIETIKNICEALSREPGVYLRINRTKTTKEEVIRLFEKEGLIDKRDFCSFHKDYAISDIDFFSDTIKLGNYKDLRKLPGFDEGYFSVQDFSSQIAVKYFLKPESDERILDICAAPGGKSSYISEITGGKSNIISVDIDQRRINLFRENINRLALKNIEIVEADVLKKDFLKGYGAFDKIFVDSPCSAFGTISKNPDVKYNKNISGLKRLAENSFSIIKNCADYLKPGGKLVFYTCTISEIENQAVVERIVNENAAGYLFSCRSLPLRAREIMSRKNSPFLNSEDNNGKKYFEILPQYFDSEGGFISILEKAQ